MTITLPFLLMILHFSQIFLTDGFTFIVSTIPFLLYLDSAILLCSPGNPSLGQVIDRNLDGYAIAGKNLDIVHTKLTRNMSRYQMAVRELDLEAGVGQCLNDGAFKLNDIIFLCQSNPLLTEWCLCYFKSLFPLRSGQERRRW
jgi:hypothetical protein